MTPELKFHSIVISITTLSIFTIWTQLTGIISKHPFLSVIATAFISLGMYRIITVIFLGFFRNISCVKKWILGPYFMEGTWIGFFVGHQNNVRLYCETFEQGLSDLVIRGKAFKDDGTYHGSWVSDTTNINVKLGKLSYTYDADVIGNTAINPGLARFDLERPSREKPPFRMIGYSSDLFNPAKLKSFEEKVSDDTVFESIEAFRKAKDVYGKYKDLI